MSVEPSPKPRMGRPRETAASAHGAIMDAVFAMLQEGSAKDLSIEAVARRAGVGKPTLYKWWPSKAALIMAMFAERIAAGDESPATSATSEDALRATMRRLTGALNGLFGKVLADLIAEGQSDPALLHDLFRDHVAARQAIDVAAIERGKRTGEFRASVDPAALIDMLFGSLIYRRIMGLPLTQDHGEAMLQLALDGAKV